MNFIGGILSGGDLLKLNQLVTFGKRLICKSPGQSQKKHKGRLKNITLISIPGDRVEERTILGKQKRLKYHPGYNVSLNPVDKSLYALVSGTVYYSIEKFYPNPKSHWVDKYYNSDNNDIPIYKKYIHVVKDREPIEFKMIDII
ncbi:39S ribosomal protein L27, mitochondrial-like [Oppia nitens]|uniref:39S ribosomal protein L27, mitochondrial-like n=1 Tax=Oppia nitens TaxID=1686743 RepID=UPI0023DAF83A|nr:39S ribosomal protein L27, mitochondrial-like [Oppia nitens]